MGDVVHVPFRELVGSSDVSLDAAMEWALAELDGAAVSTAAIRAIAERELRRPRDVTHRRWSQALLRELEQYK